VRTVETFSSTAAATGGSATIVIRPTRGPLPPRVSELWHYRELFGFLVWRDIKVRYAQTVLGATWTVFQPLAMMGVYTYAFTQLARVTTGGVPYVLYALSGLVLWTFVSRGIFQGATSLVNELALVTKTASPRILIPMAAVTSMLVDFVIALVLFLVFDAAYGRVPDWRFVFALPLLVLTFVLTFGLSLLLSALNVRYRDVGQALPFTIQLWFFLSPVAFPLLTPGHAWETYIQALNPLVGIILAFRWAVLGTPAPHGLFFVALVVTLLLLAAGIAYFSRADRTIADDV
jgi:homopolymeric O-antigen transport system permease protein